MSSGGAPRATARGVALGGQPMQAKSVNTYLIVHHMTKKCCHKMFEPTTSF